MFAGSTLGIAVILVLGSCVLFGISKLVGFDQLAFGVMPFLVHHMATMVFGGALFAAMRQKSK